MNLSMFQLLRNRNIILILSCIVPALDIKAQFPPHYGPQVMNAKTGNWWWDGLILLIAAIAVYWIIRSLQQRLKEERIISAFATSLYGQKTVEDIFWDTAKNCV